MWGHQIFIIHQHMINKDTVPIPGSGTFPPLYEEVVVRAEAPTFYHAQMVASGLESLIPQSVCLVFPKAD